MIRNLRYGSPEHQRFEIESRHVHEVGEGHVIFGDGGTSILRVVKPCRNMPKGCTDVISGPTNEWGEPFNYEDYFLPEELAVF